jgi:hypothetical protein
VALIAEAKALTIELALLPFPQLTEAFLLLMVTLTEPLSYTVPPDTPPLIADGAETVKEGDEKYELL